MITKCVTYGLSCLRKKPGLVLLLFLVNLVFAFLLSLPLKAALEEVIGSRGFGPDLAMDTDIVVWADILNQFDPVLSGIAVQLLWLVPVILLWNVASSVGVINAVRDGGIRSFWPGVGYYTGRGLLLALAFGLVGLIALLGIAVAAVLLYSIFSGEAGAFRVTTLAIPFMLVTVLGLLDVMHDYARIKLVRDEASIRTCLATGFTWPFANRAALSLYLLWLTVGAVVVILPSILDARFAASTTGTVWLLFVFQQLFFLIRSAVTVAWYGSEVYYFEQVEWNKLPLIADQKNPQTSEADDTLWPGLNA